MISGGSPWTPLVNLGVGPQQPRAHGEVLLIQRSWCCLHWEGGECGHDDGLWHRQTLAAVAINQWIHDGSDLIRASYWRYPQRHFCTYAMSCLISW